jgi:hypothetical protein
MPAEPTNVVPDNTPAFHRAAPAAHVAGWLAFASGVLMGLAALVTGAGAVTSLIVFGVPTVLALGFELASRHVKPDSPGGLVSMILLATLATFWIVNNLLIILAAIASWVGVVQAWRGRMAFRSRAT